MSDLNKKSILIATGLYPPDVGGPATYSYLLNEELSKHGWPVRILSFGEVRSWPKIIRHLVYGWKVFRLANYYQIIYAQDPVSVGLPVCLAGWLARRDFILKIVGDYAWEQGHQRFGVDDSLDVFSLEFRRYSWPVKLLKLIQTGVAKRAKKIIVPSEYLKRIVSNWGINVDKIKVIYNAFDSPVDLPAREVLRRELNLNGRIMTSAGRLVPWKGFAFLIKLMPELISLYPDLKFYIAGDGPDHKLLTKLIKEKKLTNHVFLLGQLSQERLLKFIKASDLFMLNTAYEGFSHQLLEVMWCGTPIITTKVGGNPELIANDLNGFLVEYNNKTEIKEAVGKIFDNQSSVEIMIKSAEERVKSFSRDRMITGLIEEIK